MAHTSVTAAPPPLSVRRLAALNAFWFGNGAHWQPIFIALVPEGAKLISGHDSSDLLVGRATAAGGVLALLVPLMVGRLSDRTTSRWGRRRPWMVAGTALNVIGLLLLSIAWTPAALIAFYLLVQAGNNVAGAAYSGVIPDVVPKSQRGRASGLLGTMNQLGTVVGVLLVAVVLTILGRSRVGLVSAYAVVATVLVVTLVITLPAARDSVMAPRDRPPRERISATASVFVAASAAASLAIVLLITVPTGRVSFILAALALIMAAVSLLSSMRLPAVKEFFSALRDRDFFWCFATRCLMQFGIFTVVPFMDTYFEKVVGSSNSGAASSYWLLAVIAGGVGPALIGGAISDRIGKRKPLVYASGALQAAAASVILFSLVSSPVALYGVGIVFGVGYGLYYSIDWALACDVLPDSGSAAGRDMAIWHISFTLPQVIAPTLAAALLTYLNDAHHTVLGITGGPGLGFRVVFGSAAVWFVLGTVMVRRIRGVS